MCLYRLHHLDALGIQRVRLQSGRALPHKRRLAPALVLGAHHRQQEGRGAHIDHEEAEEHGEAPGPNERRKLAALVEAAELERARARVQRKERRRDLAVRGHRRAEVRVVPTHAYTHTRTSHPPRAHAARAGTGTGTRNSRHVVVELVLLALPQQPLLRLDLREEPDVRAVELVHAPDDQHREPRDEQDRARVPEERVQDLEHFIAVNLYFIY